MYTHSFVPCLQKIFCRFTFTLKLSFVHTDRSLEPDKRVMLSITLFLTKTLNVTCLYMSFVTSPKLSCREEDQTFYIQQTTHRH